MARSKYILTHGEGTNFTYDVIRARDDRSVRFVQTDWEFPALARAFGWSGKVGRERCEHRGTDGTVKCRDCGRTATDFISAAADYLDRNLDRVRLIDDDEFSGGE